MTMISASTSALADNTPLSVDGLFLVSAALYLVSSVYFLLFLAGAQQAPKQASRQAPRQASDHADTAAGSPPSAQQVKPIARWLLAGAAALHGVHIIVYSLVLRACPVAGVHFPLSVASLMMGTTYLLLRRRFRIDALGAFVAPLALATMLTSRFIGGGALTPGARVKSAVLPFHVSVNLLGIALFSLASAAAVLYLLQERRLKEKRLEGLFQRLPPLDALDRAEHRFLLAGFPLLTLGVLSGTVWAVRVDADAVSDLVRAAFGYGTWVVSAAVLLSRASLGWRGRRAAYGTLAGYGCALVVLVLYLLRNAGDKTS
jgi:ABC-type uncharacterized transport system permease subunit